MRLELYKDIDKEWRWKIVARNGRIVAVGDEGYRKRATMKKTLRRLVDGFKRLDTDMIAE